MRLPSIIKTNYYTKMSLKGYKIVEEYITDSINEELQTITNKRYYGTKKFLHNPKRPQRKLLNKYKIPFY